MKPEELSETEKWTQFHAAMSKEREYIALWEEKTRHREKTWVLIRWAIVFWLVFVICALVSQTSFYRDLERLNDALGRT